MSKYKERVSESKCQFEILKSDYKNISSVNDLINLVQSPTLLAKFIRCNCWDIISNSRFTSKLMKGRGPIKIAYERVYVRNVNLMNGTVTIKFAIDPSYGYSSHDTQQIIRAIFKPYRNMKVQSTTIETISLVKYVVFNIRVNNNERVQEWRNEIEKEFCAAVKSKWAEIDDQIAERLSEIDNLKSEIEFLQQEKAYIEEDMFNKLLGFIRG